MIREIKKVVIVGGGTAGWMTASLIAKVLGKQVSIGLVESEEVGTIGVGEATIPPIRTFNAVLGINECEFIRETKATIKLAIRFENWGREGDAYYHTFGAAGRNTGFCSFHHFWTRARQNGIETNYWDYDLNYLCAKAGKFAKLEGNDPIWDLPYAYHFDSSLYAAFLRAYSEKLVAAVERSPERGEITALILKDSRVIEGDFFIDCSGGRGLLIQRELNTGFEDWSHWLPCDRAMAVPSERFAETSPYTRSIAHSAGWQWRIPLQHRNGNGLVYSSRHLTDEVAADLLLKNLDTPALGDPKIINFRPGRARQQWSKNVVAIGLSSGFLEPLESTSIYLIQSAIVRLLHLFPHKGGMEALAREYNRQSRIEFEVIRDFIILHYHVNKREDSQFWQDLRHMNIPARLDEKIGLFKATGQLFQDQLDIFMEPSWVQVLMGQHVFPGDYNPLADGPPLDDLKSQLAQLAAKKAEPVSQLPAHDAFLTERIGTGQ
jgi:tryptophan halogenase